jgi:hypothetical protein
MLDPKFNPYDVLASHAEAISDLIVSLKDASETQVKASALLKEYNNALIKMYTEMKSFDHRIKRLERQYNAFEQTPTNDSPKH